MLAPHQLCESPPTLHRGAYSVSGVGVGRVTKLAPCPPLSSPRMGSNGGQADHPLRLSCPLTPAEVGQRNQVMLLLPGGETASPASVSLQVGGWLPEDVEAASRSCLPACGCLLDWWEGCPAQVTGRPASVSLDWGFPVRSGGCPGSGRVGG